MGRSVPPAKPAEPEYSLRGLRAPNPFGFFDRVSAPPFNPEERRMAFLLVAFRFLKRKAPPFNPEERRMAFLW